MNIFHPPRNLNPLSSQADSFKMSNSMIQSPTEILEKARRIKTRGHISIDDDSNMMFIPPDLKKSRHGERNRMKYIT